MVCGEVMVLCVIGSGILTVSASININISTLECAQRPRHAPRPVKLIVNTDLGTSLTDQLRATHLITVRSDNGGGGGGVGGCIEFKSRT